MCCCFACGFVLLLEVFRVRFARVSCPRLRFEECCHYLYCKTHYSSRFVSLLSQTCLSCVGGGFVQSMWSHPSRDSSRWVVNARAGAGTGGQARDGVHWSTRSGPSSWRPYQTASTPHAYTFTIRSFAQTATNFPGSASLAARKLQTPAPESINWQRQRHQVGSPVFAGSPRGPALQAAREQLAESVSAASLETSVARRPPPIETVLPYRVSQSFSTGTLRRPLTTELDSPSGHLHEPNVSLSSSAFNESATSSLAHNAGPRGAPCGMGPEGAVESASPRPASSGGNPGGTRLLVTRSLNNLSHARSTPGPTAWGKHSKSVSARKVLHHSPSMELAPTRSENYWIAQRGQLTERTSINERELTKDSPLLRGGGAAHASRPTTVEPTGVNEKMPIALAKHTTAPGASVPPAPNATGDASVTARSNLERRRAGWNERFVHGSPVLDGSRRWPDAGRAFVRG